MKNARKMLGIFCLATVLFVAGCNKDEVTTDNKTTDNITGAGQESSAKEQVSLYYGGLPYSKDVFLFEGNKVSVSDEAVQRWQRYHDMKKNGKTDGLLYFACGEALSGEGEAENSGNAWMNSRSGKQSDYQFTLNQQTGYWETIAPNGEDGKPLMGNICFLIRKGNSVKPKYMMLEQYQSDKNTYFHTAGLTGRAAICDPNNCSPELVDGYPVPTKVVDGKLLVDFGETQDNTHN